MALNKNSLVAPFLNFFVVTRKVIAENHKNGKKHKNGSKSKFPHCPIFKFFVVTRGIIPEKMPPVLDPVNFFWVFSLLGPCESNNVCFYFEKSHQMTIEAWRFCQSKRYFNNCCSQAYEQENRYEDPAKEKS